MLTRCLLVLLLCSASAAHAWQEAPEASRYAAISTWNNARALVRTANGLLARKAFELVEDEYLGALSAIEQQRFFFEYGDGLEILSRRPGVTRKEYLRQAFEKHKLALRAYLDDPWPLSKIEDRQLFRRVLNSVGRIGVDILASPSVVLDEYQPAAENAPAALSAEVLEWWQKAIDASNTTSAQAKSRNEFCAVLDDNRIVVAKATIRRFRAVNGC